MDTKIKILVILLFLILFFQIKSYALDAENAHPWIAENAAKIWPFNGDLIFNVDKCIKDKLVPEDACKEFAPPDKHGFLGTYNPKDKSGTFTDKNVELFIMPETDPLIARVGKNIVEGSIEEDYNPVKKL